MAKLGYCSKSVFAYRFYRIVNYVRRINKVCDIILVNCRNVYKARKYGGWNNQIFGTITHFVGWLKKASDLK